MFSFVLSLFFFYRLCLVCPIQLRWTNKFPRNFLSCFVFNSKTKTKKKRTRRNISIRCVRFSVFCEFCVCCTFFFSPSIGSVWKVDVFFLLLFFLGCGRQCAMCQKKKMTPWCEWISTFYWIICFKRLLLLLPFLPSSHFVLFYPPEKIKNSFSLLFFYCLFLFATTTTAIAATLSHWWYSRSSSSSSHNFRVWNAKKKVTDYRRNNQSSTI